jgi:hypothetical protein
MIFFYYAWKLYISVLTCKLTFSEILTRPWSYCPDVGNQVLIFFHLDRQSLTSDITWLPTLAFSYLKLLAGLFCHTYNIIWIWHLLNSCLDRWKMDYTRNIFSDNNAVIVAMKTGSPPLVQIFTSIAYRHSFIVGKMHSQWWWPCETIVLWLKTRFIEGVTVHPLSVSFWGNI